MKRSKRLDKLVRIRENREGARFQEYLFLLFLGLKLHGSIEWSWFWVASPLILDYAITVFILERKLLQNKRMTKEILKSQENKEENEVSKV